MKLFFLSAICMLFFHTSFGQIDISTFPTCSGCVFSNEDITLIDFANPTIFEAEPAQAYFWEICSGPEVIVSGNSSQTVAVSCTTNRSYVLRLTRFVDGECVETCAEFSCL